MSLDKFAKLVCVVSVIALQLCWFLTVKWQYLHLMLSGSVSTDGRPRNNQVSTCRHTNRTGMGNHVQSVNQSINQYVFFGYHTDQHLQKNHYRWKKEWRLLINHQLYILQLKVRFLCSFSFFYFRFLRNCCFPDAKKSETYFPRFCYFPLV